MIDLIYMSSASRTMSEEDLLMRVQRLSPLQVIALIDGFKIV